MENGDRHQTQESSNKNFKYELNQNQSEFFSTLPDISDWEISTDQHQKCTTYLIMFDKPHSFVIQRKDRIRNLNKSHSLLTL